MTAPKKLRELSENDLDEVQGGNFLSGLTLGLASAIGSSLGGNFGGARISPYASYYDADPFLASNAYVYNANPLTNLVGALTGNYGYAPNAYYVASPTLSAARVIGGYGPDYGYADAYPYDAGVYYLA